MKIADRSPPQNRSLSLKNNQTIAFDGDSLTYFRSKPALDQWPWLRITNNHRSWADVCSELLFAWMPELNLKFQHTAVGGSNCRDLLARFDETIGSIQPNWVLLTLGSNDVSHGVPLAEFETSMTDYVRRIGAWGGQVVFIGGFEPMPGASEINQKKSIMRRDYYKIQHMLSETESNVTFLDVGQSFRHKAEALHQQWEGHCVYSDGNHFSHLGAMTLAGEVLKAFGVVNPLHIAAQQAEG